MTIVNTIGIVILAAIIFTSLAMFAWAFPAIFFWCVVVLAILVALSFERGGIALAIAGVVIVAVGASFLR